GYETLILLTAHRGADPGRAHGLSSLERLSAAHGAGAGGNRFDDVVVAGAAADVAFELFADGPLLEVMALAPHDIDRGHDHARSAEAALKAVVFAESFLHRMKLAVGREAFDGQHVCALGLDREHGAGLHRLAVDVDDASAALGGVAAHVRAGE